MRWSFVLILTVLLGACAPVFPRVCPKNLAPARTAYLFFGRAQAHGHAVTHKQWRQFVRVTLTHEFPNGFSVLNARGYWQGPQQAGFEASKIVIIVLPGRSDDLGRLEAVRAAYMRRFHQDSVLEWIDRGCARV
ncbi:MAG: DUF3574 domain-containing protein [Alphaproteobacteria bacterium]|nr:DUF3574 domain-containing protein [Alphaproteobacteria bacterium]